VLGYTVVFLEAPEARSQAPLQGSQT